MTETAFLARLYELVQRARPVVVVSPGTAEPLHLALRRNGVDLDIEEHTFLTGDTYVVTTRGALTDGDTTGTFLSAPGMVAHGRLHG